MQAEMLDQYRSNQAKAKSLVGRLSYGQLNWRAGGAWSVAECLAHLAASNRGVGDVMLESLELRVNGKPAKGGGIPMPGFAAQMIVGSLEPPPKFKARAAAATRPNAPGYGPEILDEYLASHDKLLEVMRRGAALRLSEVSFRHPVLPFRVPVDQGLAMMAAHDRRHLWQADQVTKNPAFPK
jgi:DinB superfamily